MGGAIDCDRGRLSGSDARPIAVERKKFLFRVALLFVFSELRRSSENTGAVSGEELRPPEKIGWSDEPEDDDVDDVPALESGLFRFIVLSRLASTSWKLRSS